MVCVCCACASGQSTQISTKMSSIYSSTTPSAARRLHAINCNRYSRPLGDARKSRAPNRKPARINIQLWRCVGARIIIKEKCESYAYADDDDNDDGIFPHHVLRFAQREVQLNAERGNPEARTLRPTDRNHRESRPGVGQDFRINHFIIKSRVVCRCERGASRRRAGASFCVCDTRLRIFGAELARRVRGAEMVACARAHGVQNKSFRFN